MSCEGVYRIMKGQFGSFGIARELPRLQRYARTLTRDEHAAEDLVHDTLLRAHDKRDTFRPGSDPTPWLLAIMRNLFVSGWRKSATERKGHDRVAAETGEPAPPSQEHSLRLRAVAEAQATRANALQSRIEAQQAVDRAVAQASMRRARLPSS